MDPVAGPYIGLQPFTEGQRDYFFGRGREVRLVGANALASKLTVLYGDSGVGKSSLLMAGVVPDLRRKPRTAVVLFREWQRTDAVASLKEAVVQAADRAAGRALGLDAALPLDDLLAAAGRAFGGTTIVLLDQFEEYFLYFPPGPAADAFDAELARAVNRRDVNVGFVLSIREDSLSRLDRLRARIPTVLANPLRIRHLREKDAREVITRPLEVWNARPGVATVAIEHALVDAVIAQTRSGKVSLARAAAPGDATAAALADDDAARIEAPYLQLVLTRLWDTEHAAGSATLRHATLASLGGAETIVRTHLDQVMQRLAEPDQALCAAFFDRLVTPSGSKIACRLDDLRQWAEAEREPDSESGSKPARAPGGEVERVVAALAGPQARILRAIDPLPGEPPQYEIFHDVLAAGVLDWRARFVAARALQRAQAEAERDVQRQRKFTLLAAAVAALGVALTVFAVYFWQRAAGERREAEARDLASRAILVGRNNPYIALLLAARAAQASGDPSVVRSLRLALAGSRLLAELPYPPERRIVAAALATDASAVALALRDGSIELRRVPSLELIARHALTGAPVGELRYDAARKIVLISRSGRVQTVWKLNSESGEATRLAIGNARDFTLDDAGRGFVRTIGELAHWIAADTGAETALKACAQQPLAVVTEGERILVAYRSDTRGASRIRICDARSGAEVDEFATGANPGGGESGRGTFSGDARLFAMHNIFTEEVDVWDRKAGKRVTLRDFTAAPVRLVFGADFGAALQVYDGTIELWKLSGLGKPPPSGPARNELVARLPAPIGTLLGAPAGTFVVSADEDALSLWQGRVAAPAGAELPQPAVAATSAAEGRVRALLADGSVGSLHPDGRFAVEHAARAGVSVVQAAASPDRSHALVAWADGRIDWWNLATGAHAIVQHDEPPVAVSWAGACCDFAARSGRQGAARLYSVGADSKVATQPLGVQPGNGWLSPSRRWWVVADGRVVPVQGAEAAAAAGGLGDAPVDRVWPFLAGERVLVASNGYNPRIVAADGAAPEILLVGHSSAITASAARPDGSQLATGAGDWHVMLWGIDNGLRVRLTGHTADIEQVLFSDDGAFVASVAADATLRVWEPLSGATLLRVELPAAKARVLDFRGSELLIAIGDDRLIRVECEPCQTPDALRTLAREQLARLSAAPEAGASAPAGSGR